MMALEVEPFGTDGHLNSSEPTGQRAGSQMAVVGGAEPVSNGSGHTRGGPRTAEGKNTVSQNAVTDGIYGLNPVAGGESEEDWEAFYEGFCRAFAPVGVPEEETVREMAMIKWRLRRVIRAETANINRRFDKIDDPESYRLFSGEIPRVPSEAELVEVKEGIAALESVCTPEDDAELVDPNWDSAMDLVLEFAEITGAPNCEPSARPWTRSSVAELLKRMVEASDTASDGPMEVADILEGSLWHADRQINDLEARVSRHNARRMQLEERAILPAPEVQEKLQRGEAHLDRKFARSLSQLELLQRMRKDTNLPPPLRISVTE